ncbi:hypothetical protein GH740_03355 [Microbacterium sp. SYP-A9085]|uniref:DUF6049 family protein n=1 Tax=Microbacterium sp. SYP-A9085 TaxID=2664454 RepID=UPI0013225D26|nr:hypothetical protein [Microbacterium sp. SYP-A9085]
MTTPAPVTRAPRHPVGPRARVDRRSPIRRIVALLIAAATVMLAAAVSGPARAADPTPTPSPEPTLSGTVEAYLSPQDGGVLRPARGLSAWATLRNGTAYSIAASQTVLRIGTRPIADRPALARWLDASTAGAGMTQVGSAAIDAVEPGDTGRTLISVPADDPTIKDLRPGVYPLAATITRAGTARTVTSVVVVPRPDSATRTPVGLVVPITAGPLTAGLLTADQLTALTALDGDLTAQLNAVAGTSAILAIDPAIPAAIRALGTAAPASATQWLERLYMLPNERFALQFGDADVAVQTRHGHKTLLQPTSLQAYMSPADFAAGPIATPEEVPATPDGKTPSPTPPRTAGPNTPEFPTLEALQYLGENTRDAVTWPFSGSADAKDVAALGTMSTDDTAALTLVPSASTAAGAQATVPARGTSGKAQVLVYDSAISDELRTAAAQDDPSVRGAALAAVTAGLDLAARTSTQPLLVAVDRAAVRPGLSAAVETVTRVPGTTAATLTALVAASPHPVTIAAAPSDAPWAAALKDLEAGERTLSSFASILEDSTLLTGPERATILQLIGGGWIRDTAGWRSALTAHREATATTLGAVSIAPTSDRNLAGTVATLGFGIRNDLPWPVNLILVTQPDDLRLEVQTLTTVVAHASSTTAARVPVRARIGNGEVSLDLQLRSPTGVRIGPPQSVGVNVHAEWEAIGLTVLGVAIGGFLALGLVRMVLARRRRRADAADADVATDADADAATDARVIELQEGESGADALRSAESPPLGDDPRRGPDGMST